jgi:hypothetical protein
MCTPPHKGLFGDAKRRANGLVVCGAGVWGLQGDIYGFFKIILQARRTGNNPQEGFVKFG